MAEDFKKQLKQVPKSSPTNQVGETKPAPPPESFRQMVGRVKPIKSSNRYITPPEKQLIKKRPVQDNQEEVPLFYMDCSWQEAPPQHWKNGQGKQDIQKLLRHQYPVIGTLDLHGHTQESLQQTLSEFCFYVRNKGVCARIIHGSGLGSQQAKPILKNIVRTWLMYHSEVLAYTEEPYNDGSVLVLFKKSNADND